MPLYAYRCTQCGHRFEKIQNFSAEPEMVCPECGGVLERPLTAPRLHFKGAGWYINDYAPKSGAPDSTSESKSDAKSDAAKSDSKSESGAPAGETKKPSTASEGSATAPAATPAPAPSATPGSSS